MSNVVSPPADPLLSSILATPDGSLQPGLADPNLAPYANGGSYLFLRNWQVDIASSTGPAAASYTRLRTTFEIEKTFFAIANKAKVEIYGLSDSSRLAYQKGGTIGISVGYGNNFFNTLTPILSYANFYFTKNERKGADIVTVFECAESQAALSNSIINQGFPAGATDTVIVAALIEALGLVQGPITGLQPLVNNNGQVISGSAKTALDTIMTKQNLVWWVSGNTVNIAPRDTPALTQVVQVSIKTGLIGTPNSGQQGLGGNNILTFEHLIDPRLVPGAYVNVQSASLGVEQIASGVIKNVKYMGDTHGNKWSVTCECAPVAPLSSPTVTSGVA